MGTLILGKVHNFGIYRKGGKRCILQLDFPGRVLLIIHKGHIKKTHTFDTLNHFDSEEGLHVSLKFTDGEIDFEADNTEEKYTICRLLSYVLTMGHGDDDESIDSGQGFSTLGDQQSDNADVIKEGLLEKKGNTTITTWNKRRVRVTAGEFSYFKPGEELALNVVQLWQDNCEVKRHGNNGFTVTVRERVYSFRLTSEYKAMNMTEIVRDEWVAAFQRALHQVSSTAKIFDQPLNGCSPNSEDPDDLYDDTLDTSKHERMHISSDKQITAHVTVHLNYFDKGQQPTQRLSTFGRRHSLEDLTSSHDKLKVTNQLSSHSDISNQSTTVGDGSDEDGAADDPFNCSAAEFRAKLAQKGGKSSSLKTYKAKQEFKKKNNSQIKLKANRAEENTLLIRNVQVEKKQREELEKCIFGDSQVMVKQDVKPTEKQFPPAVALKDNFPPSTVMERMRNMPPPPLPPCASASKVPPGAPPLPPGGPPPPPPLQRAGNSVKLSHTPTVKLKQVHWVKVNTNQISTSMWRDAHDMTDKLDLTELVDQFSIVEKKTTVVKPKPQEEKQMLVDAKRAQNLGILFSGLKKESLTKLTDALNSVTEVDSFPLDKMATLKRYQPTTEDMEMYKLYADKRDTLHQVDCFMLDLCEIPRLSTRLDLVLTLWEFPDQYDGLEEEVNDLLSGCDEMLSSTSLTAVLEYLLAIGNYMNSLWNSKQGAHGFQLSSIDKVLSVKGRDNQTTLCTYLVKQLKRNQPELLDWPKTLGHVTKCTGYSVKAVGAEIDVLKNDLLKIKKTLKVLRNHSNSDKAVKKFESSVQGFIVEFDRKMDQLDAKYLKVTEKYKQALARFAETPNKMTESLFTYLNIFMEKFKEAQEKVHL